MLQAVDEPSFSTSYANMCKLCTRLEVTKIVNDVEEKVNFRKLIITRCQMEFEKNKEAELDAEKWQEDINATTDPVSFIAYDSNYKMSSNQTYA